MPERKMYIISYNCCEHHFAYWADVQQLPYTQELTQAAYESHQLSHPNAPETNIVTLNASSKEWSK